MVIKIGVTRLITLCVLFYLYFYHVGGFFFFFFFSSRRRHTRWTGDWSSDVCSSDLATVESVEAVGKNLLIRFDNGLELRTHLRMNGSWHRYRPGEAWRRSPARARLRSEERRVGKECRSRGWPYR